ncbi:unnamed protein product [Parnassius mnemosyne]|uniref:Reverse transcriptase domain-containing protein n=1 Tax=Parnassius mnemosyne TaxID=213953 RepID=A0AAV1LEF0_9NEOP
MNTFIWRTYLIATKLNTSKIYLNHLHKEFSNKYPQMQASKQRLGDKCRAILRNKLLPQKLLDQIRNEVAVYLQQTHSNMNHIQTDSITQPHFSSQQGLTQRRRWTAEQNESIVRNYYKITELGENKSAYRRPLHQAVLDEHPELTGVSEQRISDQLRVILNNKMINDQRLQEIRDNISSKLNSQRDNLESNYSHITLQHTTFTAETENSQETDIHPYIIESNTPVHSSSLTLQSQTEESVVPTQAFEPQQNQAIKNNDAENIQELFRMAIDKFRNTNPTKRPYIPKQKTSKRLAQIVDFINTEILPNYISREQDFETTQTIIYCAAYTAAISNGTKIRDTNTLPTQIRNKEPAWQTRLTKKVQDFRRDIGRLTEYIKGNRSNRLITLVEAIKNKYRIHSQHEEPNLSDEQFLDTLKQKLNATSSRLKRYLNCTLRKSQNSQFINNEKQFYRNLTSDTQHDTHRNRQDAPLPPANELHSFWSGIWSVPVQQNTEAEWLNTDFKVTDTITTMAFEQIPLEVFVHILKKSHSWKAPGSDRIHNYWYKKLTAIHPLLHNHINNFIQKPDIMPRYITQGLTYMIPKDADHQNPAKYRPITCLQTIYKLLTACITELLHQHIANNNILAEEQKGCRKSSQGCKEQLIIDSVAMKQAISNRKNISTMYIDYRKAFDSVPHSWLLYVLQHYKIHPQIIHFLKNSMQHWKTTLKTIGTSCLEIPEIPIRRGIFQGDALSPLWFCLALNPLSQMLNKTNHGYSIITPHKHTTLTHLMYMDDIKLYSNTTQSLHRLADITQSFSNDIHMEFGIDKCKTFSVKNRKINRNSYSLISGDTIEPLEPLAAYKYLGFQQARQIHQKETKEDLKKKFKHRLNSIFRSQLNSRNMSKAINSYAIPILTYSFGVISWTQGDLTNLQRIINTTLTAHRKHHPRSCVQRMTLSRSDGGRGIIDVLNLHNKEIKCLRQYFYQRSEHSPFHEIVTLADKRFTPLNLADRNTQRNERITDVKEKIASWQQ